MNLLSGQYSGLATSLVCNFESIRQKQVPEPLDWIHTYISDSLEQTVGQDGHLLPEGPCNAIVGPYITWHQHAHSHMDGGLPPGSRAVSSA